VRNYLFALFLLVTILPACIGCGGSQESYQDRQGTVDPAAAPEMPEKPAQ
jgi:hypothetical protein